MVKKCFDVWETLFPSLKRGLLTCLNTTVAIICAVLFRTPKISQPVVIILPEPNGSSVVSPLKLGSKSGFK